MMEPAGCKERFRDDNANDDIHRNGIMQRASHGRYVRRVFRDGGAPADALEAFGLAHEDMHGNWRTAVERIAEALCRARKHR